MKLINIALAENKITKIPEGKNIGEIIAGIIEFILPVAAGVAVLAVMYAGVLYITSQGDPEKVGKAKKALLWAIVGVIIIVLSYAIVIMINNVVNNKII